MAHNDFIDIVCDRIKSDKDNIERNEIVHIEVDSFNLKVFWSEFGALVQAVSNEVTKISFVCGKEPYPSNEEVGGLMGDLLQCYALMNDSFLVLPEEVGEQLYKKVSSTYTAIQGALISVVESLKDLTQNGAKGRLTLTGVFWEACKAVEELPKNSLDLTLQALDTEADLAKDALNELQTEESVVIKKEPTESQDLTTEVWTTQNVDDSGRSTSGSNCLSAYSIHQESVVVKKEPTESQDLTTEVWTTANADDCGRSTQPSSSSNYLSANINLSNPTQNKGTLPAVAGTSVPNAGGPDASKSQRKKRNQRRTKPDTRKVRIWAKDGTFVRVKVRNLHKLNLSDSKDIFHRPK